jgi:thiol-disulfide isomerase/thioredoxin
LGILLAASNFTLARENRRLTGLAHYYASLRHTPEGVALPDLSGKDRDGRDLTISYKDVNQETLLLVFSPTCPHCKRNWPVWLDLARGAGGKRVVFVNVGGALPADFAQVYSFDSAAVMAETSPESILKYSFLETPITIAVSPDGRSEKVSSGELGPADVAAFKKLLARPAIEGTSRADPGVHEKSVR